MLVLCILFYNGVMRILPHFTFVKVEQTILVMEMWQSFMNAPMSNFLVPNLLALVVDSRMECYYYGD